MPLPIRDYALIGDCETAALVGRNGSIDWLCWPRFDSEACFAALLGEEENGAWRIAPVAERGRSTRRYLGDAPVLETTFETADGVVTVTDFMPVRGAASDLVRIVTGRAGRVPMRSALRLRFGYGRASPWIERAHDGEIKAIGGPHAVVLRAGTPQTTQHGDCLSEFDLGAGERVAFVLTYFASHHPTPDAVEAEAALNETLERWRRWLSRCAYDGPYGKPVWRALMVMKALTYRPTGGMVAAATTSLPERIGGERNWDYRYCWLRDATFMLLAFLHSGFEEEAFAWRDWLVRAVAGDPRDMQPIYGIAGEQHLLEWVTPDLRGYLDSAPVRIGNAAYRQRQLDVYGEVLDALHQARRHDRGHHEASWSLQRAIVDHLTEHWREPDCGIWEVRSEPLHFTHSKAMAWVAFDRAVQAIERFGLEGDLDRWRRMCEENRHEVLTKGFDAELGSFTRAYGSGDVDASLLLLPQVGFIDARDPRMIGTVRAIELRLLQDGLLRRYDTRQSDDGLPPGEGAFMAASFWLADTYIMQGRIEDAEALFERLLACQNDVGLLPEEIDPRTGAFLGNFPQALSHLSLVDTAYNLAEARGPAVERGARDG
ncbi:MAG TPA: glycoside hydrolase family 15 protein [Vitreimonas sp.]|uniref:glycoside hydrolase family 15 protein n=1 Tax=Vitreimonas sp. TaxID=3069702 RepID=UPI002D32D41C|nr:glycoside hydrolase family 15 protein [Vitreimonas sp.]HYD89283.1 glycoside hydrolase family 15 protein [Vitreimonas sp.]